MPGTATSRARTRARRAAYTVFGHLPPWVRRSLVGVVAPSYTVGALAVLTDGDMVLFVTQVHRPGLSLPGGLLQKGEAPRTALARELAEELSLDPSGIPGTPDTAYVDPAKTRVDLIFFVPADRKALTPVVGAEVLSYEWRRTDDPALTPQTREILQAIDTRMANSQR